jgi:succinate dehydrogenase/fumarate reductase flavoprotein subunit
MALLRECLDAATLADPARLAAAIKALPVALIAPAHRRSHQHRRRPALRGARREAHGAKPPGLFCAGEMLDWEAPTGGYLLTACFASGRRAAEGVLAWLAGAQGQGNTY